ncbi:MAG: IS1 family transposase [Cyanothece sp. SIO1E1]|nr:IS1 family transposase [Cyanothece sp. SIO1E1]
MPPPESQKVCPRCGSHNLIKNGSIHNGKPKHACKDCGKQFIDKPQNIQVSSATKQLIDKLLLERISLRGIVRVTTVSWDWLQQYVNRKMDSIPRQVRVSAKTKRRLIIECDEMWAFVGSKKNPVYTWLTIDRDTREIVGCFIGDRTRKSARKLWASLPGVYRQCAVAYTDFWQSYEKVIPANRHRAVGKETGETNHIERLNNTFRQRLSRLVRKSLSFSKKLNNHIGAIWYFIHHYNAQLAKV